MHHVAYCFDANYRQHFAASLLLLFTNYGGDITSLTVHIVSDLPDGAFEDFLEGFSERMKISCRLYYIEYDHLSLLKKYP